MPRFDDPAYVPALQELCEEFGVGAVVPLTDLDLEILGHARTAGQLPAFVPDGDVARATFDKYETHLLLERLGLPSPPTVLPGEPVARYPVMIKPRWGSGARSIHLAQDEREAEFLAAYIREPAMLQRAMQGPEFSMDCMSDLDGRCLNVIPRTMIESRGGESIKGTTIADEELIDLGRRVVEALGCRGPCTVQAFRDAEIGLGITDVNTRFGGACPAHLYAALPGQTYPELIVRIARGERIEPHVGDFRPGVTFTRYFWQLELDDALEPTGAMWRPEPPGRSRFPGRPDACGVTRSAAVADDRAAAEPATTSAPPAAHSVPAGLELSGADAVLRLQRTAGNRRVARMADRATGAERRLQRLAGSCSGTGRPLAASPCRPQLDHPGHGRGTSAGAGRKRTLDDVFVRRAGEASIIRIRENATVVGFPATATARRATSSTRPRHGAGAARTSSTRRPMSGSTRTNPVPLRVERAQLQAIAELTVGDWEKAYAYKHLEGVVPRVGMERRGAGALDRGSRASATEPVVGGRRCCQRSRRP